MPKFKELPWVHADSIVAEALGMKFSITPEEGKYWGVWSEGKIIIDADPKEGLPDGFANVEDAKASAQAYFEKRVNEFIDYGAIYSESSRSLVADRRWTYFRVLGENYDSGWVLTGRAEFNLLRTNVQRHVDKYCGKGKFFFIAKTDHPDLEHRTPKTFRRVVGTTDAPSPVTARQTVFNNDFPLPANMWDD